MEIIKKKKIKGKWRNIYFCNKNKPADVNIILQQLNEPKKKNNIIAENLLTVMKIELTSAEQIAVSNFQETNVLILPVVIDLNTLIVTDACGIVDDIEENDLKELKEYILKKYPLAEKIEFTDNKFKYAEITENLF